VEPPANKILITGASGFLGAHITRAFLDSGWSVYAGVRKSSDTWRLNRLINYSERLNLTTIDLLDPGTQSAALAEIMPQVVIHCAAYGVDYRQQDFDTAVNCNVTGTVLLVQAAAENRIERFIHVGTCYEYGDQMLPITEDTCLRPQGLYGSTKAAGTILSIEKAESSDLPLVVIRPFGMYGPLEGEHKFVPQVVRACLSEQIMNLTPGEQIRDYIYVADIVKACVLLAECDHFPSGEILNLGSGQPISMQSFGKTIAELIGQGGTCLQWGKLPYRKGEIMHIVADTQKTKQLLGWQATTSLSQGLQATIEFIRSEKVDHK